MTMNANPVLKKLGLSDTDRVAIIHTDDIGMCQASVDAFADLNQAGIISSGAVMVPCPWFLHAAEYARQHPQADLGIHLTLTSEWKTYRWGPISTRDPASGMIDEEGFFYHRSREPRSMATRQPWKWNSPPRWNGRSKWESSPPILTRTWVRWRIPNSWAFISGLPRSLACPP